MGVTYVKAYNTTLVEFDYVASGIQSRAIEVDEVTGISRTRRLGVIWSSN
jgi:hypothetical protein